MHDYRLFADIGAAAGEMVDMVVRVTVENSAPVAPRGLGKAQLSATPFSLVLPGLEDDYVLGYSAEICRPVRRRASG